MKSFPLTSITIGTNAFGFRDKPWEFYTTPVLTHHALWNIFSSIIIWRLMDELYANAKDMINSEILKLEIELHIQRRLEHGSRQQQGYKWQVFQKEWGSLLKF